MADRKGGIAKKVRNAVEAPIKEAGYKLWDVSYYKEGSQMILEIAIDRENGISINDCSVVTKLIEPVIDELDPIENGYNLIVSSAGTVRNLTRDEHIKFACEQGLKVSIGLFAPVDGKKEFEGIITSFGPDNITMDCGSAEYTFDKKQITKINAEFISETDESRENKENNNEQGTV